MFLSTPNQFRRLFERVTTLLENLEQATIAMVNGHAIGGGVGLTLACDFRWAAAEAMFGSPRSTWACPSGWGRPRGSSAWWARRAPRRSSWSAGGTRRPRRRRSGSSIASSPAPQLAAAVREYAETLAAKPFRPLAEVKARINAIARTGIPEVNAMTEGFLSRE